VENITNEVIWVVAKGNYERVEVTFSKNEDIDKILYEYLEGKAKIIGKGTYLKQLLYENMLKEKGSE